jgi:hypothetical protein
LATLDLLKVVGGGGEEEEEEFTWWFSDPAGTFQADKVTSTIFFSLVPDIWDRKMSGLVQKLHTKEIRTTFLHNNSS